MPAYPCPLATCDEEFETSGERAEHLAYRHNGYTPGCGSGMRHVLTSECGRECDNGTGFSTDSDSFEY